MACRLLHIVYGSGSGGLVIVVRVAGRRRVGVIGALRCGIGDGADSRGDWLPGVRHATSELR